MTNSISGNVSERIKAFLNNFCSNINAKDYSIIEPLKPYYKFNEYGVMLFEFNTMAPLEKIKNALGIGWDDNTIDSKRGTIYCEDIAFLWLSY